MADNTIEVIIKGLDESQPAFASLNANLGDTRDSFDLLDHAISFAGEVLADFVVQALSAAGRAIVNLGQEMIESNAQFEQYATQFSVLLGSVDAAEQRMAELAEFGATTPFDLPGVVEADRILQGFGLHAEDVAERFGFSGEEIRRIAGDVAAGTGASFQEMALLIGRFSAGATGEALQRMAELGIGTRDQLRAMGIEFSKAGELLTPLPEAMDAVLQLMQEKYGGMMEAQSHTFEGMMSNLRDWAGQTIRQVGQPIFEILSEKLETLLTFLNSGEVRAGLESLALAFGQIGGIIATALLPFVEDAIQILPGLAVEFGEVVNDVVGFISDLVEGSKEGILSWSGVLITALSNLNLPPAVLTPVESMIHMLHDLQRVALTLFGADSDVFEDDPAWLAFLVRSATSIHDLMTPIAEWIDRNVTLNDALVVFGGLLASTILPALVSFVSAFATPLALIAGAVLAVAALRTAWETDFLGIQTSLTTFWEGTLFPIFAHLKNWFTNTLPPIIEDFAAVWRDDLLPELSEIWEIVSGEILPLFDIELPNAVGVASTIINGLTKTLSTVQMAFATWAEKFRAASTDVKTVIQGVKQAASDVDTFFTNLGASISGWWDTSVKPIFDKIGEWAQATLPAALAELKMAWDTEMIPAFQELSDVWESDLKPGLDAMLEALGSDLPEVSLTLEDALSVVSDVLVVLTDGIHIAIDVISFLMRTFRQAVEAIDDVNAWVLRMDRQFLAFVDTLRNRVETAINTVVGIWENSFLPVIRSVWSFVNEHVIPVFVAMGNVLQTAGELGSTILAGVWQNVLFPALNNVWNFVNANVLPIFRHLGSVLQNVVGGAVGLLSDLWNNNLLPAFGAIWDFISVNVLPIFRTLADFISGAFTSKVDTFRLNVLDPLSTGFGKIAEFLDGITDGLNDFAGGLKNIEKKLPDWMTPGSATPFELGLAGISRAMDQLSQQKMPQLGLALNGLQQQAGSNTSNTQQLYNLTINSNAPAESAITDFSVMKALAGGNAG